MDINIHNIKRMVSTVLKRELADGTVYYVRKLQMVTDDKRSYEINIFADKKEYLKFK